MRRPPTEGSGDGVKRSNGGTSRAPDTRAAIATPSNPPIVVR